MDFDDMILVGIAWLLVSVPLLWGIWTTLAKAGGSASFCITWGWGYAAGSGRPQSGIRGLDARTR